MDCARDIKEGRNLLRSQSDTIRTDLVTCIEVGQVLRDQVNELSSQVLVLFARSGTARGQRRARGVQSH